MILYNKAITSKMKSRPVKSIDLEIEEKPERPVYVFKSVKDRIKFIKTCEAMIRKSLEYKEYIKFLKDNMDMSHCEVLKNISNENGRHYTIEIHHEPFYLFDIVDTVITKREACGESTNPFDIAEEVMALHYDEKIGLIPLSKTAHELVHSDRIFIPLQLIYQNYNKFYDEYEQYMSQNLKEQIEMKVNISLKTSNILSDVMDPEFVYVNIDGFDFPEVPEEWGKAIKVLDVSNLTDGDADEPTPDRNN